MYLTMADMASWEMDMGSSAAGHAPPYRHLQTLACICRKDAALVQYRWDKSDSSIEAHKPTNQPVLMSLHSVDWTQSGVIDLRRQCAAHVIYSFALPAFCRMIVSNGLLLPPESPPPRTDKIIPDKIG